jgi:autotransporter-associated beta strand protein
MMVAYCGTAQAAPTTVTIPNYNFQSWDLSYKTGSWHSGGRQTTVQPDGSVTPYNQPYGSYSYAEGYAVNWYPGSGDGTGWAVMWNPASTDFATAGGNGVLPGTAAGSQCFLNAATTYNCEVSLCNGNSVESWGQSVVNVTYNKRYTMTVAVGSALGATIMDGQSIAFADITQKALVLSHEDMYPNGWYNTGGGGPSNMSGFMGWGGFGDISYSISSNNVINSGIVGNGDGLLTILGTAAGTCWSNVRMISQNWAPTYAAGTFNWDNATTAAWAPSTGGPYNANWTAGADAVLEGNGGTVTVSQNITSVNSLNFNTDWRTLGNTSAGYQWIPTYTINPSGAGAITLTGDAVITVGAGTDATTSPRNVGGGTALISCPISGTNGMYKAGGGFLILTGANNYNNSSLPSGTPATTVGGGTLMLGYGGTASPLSGGTTGTIQGNVLNLANLAFNYSSAAPSAVTTFGGNISGTGSVDILGTGTTTFTSNNTYAGITTIHAGSTLQIGNGSTATAGAIVGDVVNNGTLIFNRAVSVSYSGIIYDGSTFFPSTAGANPYSSLYANYNGVNSNNAEVAHAGNLIQAGTAGLTLDNSQMRYTGTTTVSAGGGGLKITSASPSMAVLNTTKTNVNGFLVLDYSANTANETSLVTQVVTDLHIAYNGGSGSFQSGHGYQIYSTSATATQGLGWVDNATTHQVTVMPALYGDCNLDGVVNFSDLNKVLTNYNLTNMTWSQGDCNYDGVVNFADLNKVLTNYNLTGPLNINNLPVFAFDSLEADSQAMQLLAKDGITLSQPVPEPSSLVMLASLLTMAGVWGFRRRRSR